jgi:hypothetical protein
MAIGPDGKVTTTGLMDAGMKTPDAPDMSNLKPPAQAQEKTAPAAMVQKPEAKDPAVVEKLNALSDEEKVQLDMVLAPSLATILKKIAPDASSVIDQFTSTEENVVLPVSVVKNFAVRKYPSSSEQESLQGFVTELSESQSDNTNVPPENMTAANPNGMMVKDPSADSEIAPETVAIDEGQLELA